MRALAKLRQKLFGKPLDPLDTKTRRHIALVAFFAWVGLGADGISSSCYGPEEAFRALGEHTDLGLYLALATAATVFIIALAYNQVIELFPTGGGGYRVATRLIGPYAGLVSGAALILDYVLTVSISIASGVDALFSLFPLPFQRSEEHTSELQSQSNLVCRLLLEKKKKTSTNIFFMQSTFSYMLRNLFSRLYRKSTTRQTKHSGIVTNNYTRHTLVRCLLNTTNEQ